MKKVLIVEDCKNSSQPLKEKLLESGFEVNACESGESALTSLRSAFPDLIITHPDARSYDGGSLVIGLKNLGLLDHIPVVVSGEDRKKLRECAENGVFVNSDPTNDDELVSFLMALV